MVKKNVSAVRKVVQFPIWKTINLGTGFKTADDFRKALKTNGYCISDWANDILGNLQFTIAQEKTEIDLVVVSASGSGI